MQASITQPATFQIPGGAPYGLLVCLGRAQSPQHDALSCAFDHREASSCCRWLQGDS